MADQPVSQLQRIQDQARTLVDDQQLATQEPSQVHPARKFIHFWVLVAKSFIRNRCPVRASALAYSSLLALIPMLAVVLSVTTSILKKQGEEPIQKFVDQLVQYIAPYTAPVDAAGDARTEIQTQAAAARKEAVDKINEFIKRTQSGAIGVTGMVALVFVAISMLSRIEATFNDIWGVLRGRSWYMRVVLYWTTITLGPVALITALGLASGSHVETTRRLLLYTPLIGNLIFELLPLVVLCLSFAMLYLLVPNTRVQFSAALVGGLVGGLLWHLNNKLSVLFVSRFVSNNAIYGSLSMVPIFMIGLYFGWLILLFGAQVAYAYQNRRAYLQERLAEGVNQRGREFAAVRLMTQMAQRFHQGQKPLGLNPLAEACGVPTRLTGQVLQTLVQSQLVVEVLDRETAYTPARPLDRITVRDILTALRTGTGRDLATREDTLRGVLRSEMARVDAAERTVAEAVTLQGLVERAG